jgi:aminoglycoside phosphotransferase (APT) family kinase protein
MARPPESRWEDATTGDRLVHGDVRSDNILLTTDGRVVFVDWSSACIGADWFDLVTMLASIELEGGGTPESVLKMANLQHPERETVTPVVAAFAGYFAERSRLPDPPGLPTVRAFQRAQGHVTVAWLRRLLSAT